MAGYTAIPYGATEDEGARRRREEAEASARATEEANAAFARQQAEAAPPPVVPPAPAVAAPEDPFGGMTQLPPGTTIGALPEERPAPRVEVKKPTARGEPRPAQAPEQQQPIATVASRAGNTTVQTPLMPGGEVDQKTVRSGTTRSQVQVSKDELAAQKELDAVRTERAEQARQAEQVLADKAVQVQAIRDRQVADEDAFTKQVETEYNARLLKAQQAEDEYKKLMAGGTRQAVTNKFYADMSTRDKIGAGISLLLGIVGGLNDGSNVGAERINKAIDTDIDIHQKRLSAQERILERARGDVTSVKRDLQWKKDLLDVRKATMLDGATADAEARAARMGIPPAVLNSNEGYLDLKQKAGEARAKFAETSRVQVQNEVSTSRVVTAGGPGGIPANIPQAERDAAAGLLRLSTSLDEITRLPKLTPADVQDIQRNETLMTGASQSKGITGAIGQIAGRFVGAIPESSTQGLPSAKGQAHNAWQNIRAAILSVESGKGASDAEKQDAVSRYTPVAGDDVRTIANKERLARQYIQDNMLTAGRAAPVVQQRLQQGQQPPAAPSQPAPAAPGGARRGRVNGKPAMIYPDGTYEPID